MHYVVALHLQRDDGVSATDDRADRARLPARHGRWPGRSADASPTGTAPRPVAVTGAALTAAGLLLLVPLGNAWSPSDVAWRLALAGIGMGLNGGPTQALVMGAAPPDRIATVGSTVQFARSLGFTLGPALATAAWALAGPGDGVRRRARPGSRRAACLAVPLLALPGRRRAAAPEQTTDAAPAAHT